MTAQPRATASLRFEERFCVLRNGVRICYCTHGSPSAEPLVLIAGLGLDLTWWPAAFIDGLVARGYYVICFDNRDAGRSTHVNTRPPSLWRLVMRRPRNDGYDLTDMADDVAGLLDACGLSSAHVVGMSMGGMIGQMLAAKHPSRVRTLTSVFSTTGARGVGGVALSTLLRLAGARARDERTAIEGALRVERHIGKGPHPFDEQEVRAYAERAFRRGAGVPANAGFARQINAILKSGDRTPALRSITAPTLVLHGDVDRMVHPSGGHATAASIPGAKLVTVRGMRHSFAREVVPQLIDLIASHAPSYADPATSETMRVRISTFTERAKEHNCMDIQSTISSVPRVKRPEHVQVKPRNLRFGIPNDVPRYWFDNDPFMTSFMNSLTLTFPRGERSFIESVKAVRDQVKSPALRADVAGFVGQEALHSREHDALNDVLEKMGYPIHALENEFSAALDKREGSMSKKSQLAFTAAMEHLTALFGRLLLTREDVRSMIHPELRAIWLWHALEEIEHKAVAFDVYQEVFDDDTTRRLALILATGAFLTFTHYSQYQLLKRDGLANKPSVWAKGLWKLWGPKGVGRAAIPTWLEYLRRDFHPWQEDDSALIAEFETSILPRAHSELTGSRGRTS